MQAVYVPSSDDINIIINNEDAYRFIENIKLLMITYGGEIDYGLFRKHVSTLMNNTYNNVFRREFNNLINLERDRLQINHLAGYTVSTLPFEPLYEGIITDEEYVDATQKVQEWNDEMYEIFELE